MDQKTQFGARKFDVLGVILYPPENHNLDPSTEVPAITKFWLTSEPFTEASIEQEYKFGVALLDFTLRNYLKQP